MTDGTYDDAKAERWPSPKGREGWDGRIITEPCKCGHERRHHHTTPDTRPCAKCDCDQFTFCSPKGREEREAFLKAVRRLVVCARTTGGTAGPDQGLMEACEAVEDSLRTHSPSRAQREPEWVADALRAIEIAKEDGDEGSPPCICDGDNVALQVLCRAFDEDPADLMEEWRAYDKSKWFWWGRALGGFMGQKIRALRTHSPEEPVGWQPIETAPKDGTHILAWFHDDSPMRAYLGEHQSGLSIAAWIDHNGGGWVSNRFGEPTHWMPLPKPPIGQPLDPEGSEP